jgi:hypothetical protein
MAEQPILHCTGSCGRSNTIWSQLVYHILSTHELVRNYTLVSDLLRNGKASKRTKNVTGFCTCWRSVWFPFWSALNDEWLKVSPHTPSDLYDAWEEFRTSPQVVPPSPSISDNSSVAELRIDTSSSTRPTVPVYQTQ